MTVWFSSDFHFQHRMVAQHRGYDDVDQHDEDIIRWWNNLVQPADAAWILGDLALTNPRNIWRLVDRLNGEKHLITGNHDKAWPGDRDARKWQREYMDHFATVQPFARRSINGRRVLLSHFPYAGSGDHTAEERCTQYRLPDLGEWLLCGHVHWAWKQNLKMINVGLDAWQMCPVREEQLSILLNARPAYAHCPPTPMAAANEHTRLSEELGT